MNKRSLKVVVFDKNSGDLLLKLCNEDISVNKWDVFSSPIDSDDTIMTKAAEILNDEIGVVMSALDVSYFMTDTMAELGNTEVNWCFCTITNDDIGSHFNKISWFSIGDVLKDTDMLAGNKDVIGSILNSRNIRKTGYNC